MSDSSKSNSSFGSMSYILHMLTMLSYDGFLLPSSHWHTVVWLTPMLSANACCVSPRSAMTRRITSRYFILLL